MRLLIAAAVLAGCAREPIEAAAPPPPPAVRPAVEPGADPGQVGRAAPEDALIAFVRGCELWTLRPDGTGERRVIRMDDPKATIAAPAWSPNRKWIAFSSTAGGDRNLYPRNLFVVGVDGAGLRQVTPMPGAGEPAAASAATGIVRGRAVARVGVARLGMEGFTIVSAGGPSPGRTSAGGVFEAVVPAGTRWIKIGGTFKERRYSGAAMRTVTAGGTVDVGDILLTPGGADEEAHNPAWSTDGSLLYHVLRAPDEKGAGLFKAATLNRIRVDGSGQETVYLDPAGLIEAGPAVTGDHAFVKMRDGRLLCVSLAARRLVQQWDAGVSSPDAVAVAPDGTVVAYPRLDERLNVQLIVRERCERALLTFPASEGLIFGLDFSPDGRHIVFDRRRGDGVGDLWIVEIASAQVRPLTKDGTSVDPVWHGR